MTDRKIRIVGISVLTATFLMTYLSVYRPLEAAKNHVPEIQLRFWYTAWIPTGFLIGGLVAFFGQRGRDWIQTEENGNQRLKAMGWVLALVCLIAGVVFPAWLEVAISDYGYEKIPKSGWKKIPDKVTR